MKMACIIPTYNGQSDIRRLLDSLDGQFSIADLYVVDSTSTDGTLELLKKRVSNLSVIPSKEFNHGGTRQLMVEICCDYDVCVFLTQDAYLQQSTAIAELLKPFDDEKVGAVCGRQLPHINASYYAQHTRSFNYPEYSVTRSMLDVPKHGLKTAFMSNSFAAYRTDALRSVGGFPRHVIFAEDMYVAARMLMVGWKIAYSASAECRHSHNYSIKEEFARYFDMGVFHAREPWIGKTFGSAGSEGLNYVYSELKFLGFSRFLLWPSSLLRNLSKLIGYRLGQYEAKLHKSIKIKCGMHKQYWSGPFA